jgi:hypothetical protein
MNLTRVIHYFVCTPLGVGSTRIKQTYLWGQNWRSYVENILSLKGYA